MMYYSYRTRKSLSDGHIFLPFGFAHYSYGSVCQKFLSALAEGSIHPIELLMPEIYAEVRHAPQYSGSQRPIHIAFKPFDEIRLLKGAINIAHVAWEFDIFPDISLLPRNHKKRENPTNDYLAMLRMVSEIWVGSTFTKTVFERHGLKNVHVVPAPIRLESQFQRGRSRTNAMTNVGFTELTRKTVVQIDEGVDWIGSIHNLALRAEDCHQDGGRVYLSVLNPGDPRKNVAALLFGFQSFIERSRRSDILIVKLVIDGSHSSLRDSINLLLPRAFGTSGLSFSFIDCKNILVVYETLSEANMSALYGLADFYVCSSGAEGQGLPILEAMAAGLPPISSRETAMADYVTEENAVVLPTVEEPIPLQISETYSLPGLQWRVPDYKMIEQSLWTATKLSDIEYRSKAQAAKETVDRLYSEKYVLKVVQSRLDSNRR